MRFLWFRPKRVWFAIIEFDTERGFAFTSGDLCMIRCTSLIDEFRSDVELLSSIYGPCRFMERIAQCLICNDRWLLDDCGDMIPWHPEIDGPPDVQALSDKSFPPILIADVCRHCARTETERQDRLEEQAESIRIEADLRKQKQDEIENMRAQFYGMRSNRVAGKLMRCTVCAKLVWTDDLPRRYRRTNTCSSECSAALSQFIASSRAYIKVAECSDEYIENLLGGISTPPLVECKRLQIQLSRVLKKKKHQQYDNEHQRPECGTSETY